MDSCVDDEGRPAALGYLNQIGVDAGTAVRLIVVTTGMMITSAELHGLFTTVRALSLRARPYFLRRSS